MGVMLKSFGESLSILKRDKVVLFLSFVPVLIGLIIYYFLGQWVYTDVLGWANTWVDGQISSQGLSSFFKWIVVGILSIGLYFIVSWTFILFISIVASPFNDLISSRVEKIVAEKTPDSISSGFSKMLKKLLSTLFNEIKKVAFIAFFSILAFFLSLAPFLAPLSVLISAVLLAVSFVDYSWSRHDTPFKSCVGDIKSSFFVYGFSGAIFLVGIAIPVLNLFVLPYAVIYYTVLFTKKNIKIGI